MSSMNHPCLQFISILVLCYNFGQGLGLHIKITPNKASQLVTDEVEIKCGMNDTPEWKQSVMSIGLGKKGEHPLVVLQQQKLENGPGIKSNMKAEGRIDLQNTTQSFLKITIKNPKVEDAGQYRCRIFYLDIFGELKEGKVYANLTVNDNIHEVVRHLTEELSTVKKELKEHKAKTYIYKNSTHEVVRHLTEELSTVKKELKEYKAKTDGYIVKDNVTSAFMAGYSSSDKLIIGQVMKFRFVKLNIGGNYNVGTNTYTAPVDGIYTFNLFLWVIGSNQQIQARIRVNGVDMAALNAWNNGHYDQSSVSPVVQLKAGDAVNCYVHYQSGSDIAYTFPWTAFSGYLLKAI